MSTDVADKDQKPRDYGPPFDDSDADLILRSSDLVDFYAYKPILAKSSPVFRDMFSVPQPASDATGPRNLPIIPLSETSTDLAMALTFCCPVQRPVLTVQDAGNMLRIAEKYAMDWLYREMKDLLKQPGMAREYPIRVFGLAWELKLEDVARVAAKECLRMELTLKDLAAGKELDFISGPALRRLALYHGRCTAVAKYTFARNGEIHRFTVDAWSCGCNRQHYTTDDNGTTLPSECRLWYTQEASHALDNRPWPPIVYSAELAKAAHLKSGRCETCLWTITEALERFTKNVWECVEAAISKVSIDLPFSDKADP